MKQVLQVKTLLDDYSQKETGTVLQTFEIIYLIMACSFGELNRLNCSFSVQNELIDYVGPIECAFIFKQKNIFNSIRNRYFESRPSINDSISPELSQPFTLS